MTIKIIVTDEHYETAETFDRKNGKGTFCKTKGRVQNPGVGDYIICKIMSSRPLRPGEYTVDPYATSDQYGNLQLRVGEVKPVKAMDMKAVG